MNRLFEVAVDVQGFCDRQQWPCCFIGGVAVQRWGEPRVTRDVDLTLLTGFGDEERFVQTLLTAYRSRISDPLAFARRNRVVLLETDDRVGIDISLGALPFEETMIMRASVYSFGPGLDVRTCSAEDLIVLKLFAGRALDIRDAQGVAIRHKGALNWFYIEEQLRPLAELKDDGETMELLTSVRALSR